MIIALDEDFVIPKRDGVIVMIPMGIPMVLPMDMVMEEYVEIVDMR